MATCGSMACSRRQRCAFKDFGKVAKACGETHGGKSGDAFHRCMERTYTARRITRQCAKGK